jgi:hypothetical protein
MPKTQYFDSDSDRRLLQYLNSDNTVHIANKNIYITKDSESTYILFTTNANKLVDEIHLSGSSFYLMVRTMLDVYVREFLVDESFKDNFWKAIRYGETLPRSGFTFKYNDLNNSCEITRTYKKL